MEITEHNANSQKVHVFLQHHIEYILTKQCLIAD
jgi:hypothetical protein